MRLGWLALVALVLTGDLAPARAESPIKSDEEVIVFPSAARRDGAEWIVPVHGWIFEPEEDSLWRGAIVASLLEVLDLSRAGAEGTTFARRARWFLVDNERGKRLRVRAGDTVATMQRSGKDGHFRGELRVPASSAADWITLEVETRNGDARRFRGRARLVADAGLSVISDIDDTVRITGVLDRREMLESTFLRPFRAAPGMPELFGSWQKSGAVFHYVSASPWQLYAPLSAFFARVGLPGGTMHLREFRVKDDRRWNLLAKPAIHKRAAIAELLTRYPHRRFALVGDSGQHDPEIYAAIAREHPLQIVAVLIRRVPGDGFDAARKRKAFAGVQAPVYVFRKTSELPASVRAGQL